MKIRYLGHSAFEIESRDKKILIDPYLSENPNCPVNVEDMKPDIICITHDHSDHVGDAIHIAKNSGAKIVSISEIAKKLGGISMNIGGTVQIDDIAISMVPAIHSACACGFIIQTEDATVYHAGDTGFFSDMKLIGEKFKPTIALLPVDGVHTMGIEDAKYAVKYLRPRYVIPMHYNTWKENVVDIARFNPPEAIILNPGDVLDFSGDVYRIVPKEKVAEEDSVKKLTR